MSGGHADAAAGSFTPEEERLHVEGFLLIEKGLAAGKGFEEACAALEVADPQLRRVIVDDFLKVTIARRHFEGGETTDAVAAALRVPLERVERARGEMIAEVAARSVELFRQRSGEGSPPPAVN